MATLVQFQKNLRKLLNRNALELILFEEIKRYENVFINLQKKQLNEGESNDGSLFGVYKLSTQNWARNYTPKKPKIAGEPYNFEDMGDLFDGMELRTDGKIAEIYSTDGKTDELIVKYKGLFGLQEENLKEVISRVIYPAFMIQIRQVLGL